MDYDGRRTSGKCHVRFRLSLASLVTVMDYGCHCDELFEKDCPLRGDLSKSAIRDDYRRRRITKVSSKISTALRKRLAD